MKALILGITGQDGSYLADILLERGYEVHGMYRRTSTDNTGRISHILDKIKLHQGDLADFASVSRIVKHLQPDELYNEADQDDVGWSKSLVMQAVDITFGGAANVFEAVRINKPWCRIFQPVSATMFSTASWPQNESTRLDPRSPYACAKAATYHLARYYREEHHMFISTGIFYNHDSPRRSESYLLNKICKSACRIGRGEQQELLLGNLETHVDVGYARDYMLAANKLMQFNDPGDYVICSEEDWTIRELVEQAFSRIGLSPADVDKYVKVDPRYYVETPQRFQGSMDKLRHHLPKHEHTIKDLIHLLVAGAKS